MPASPVILEKLAVFNRRWRQLILLRGLCGAAATLLGGLTLAALLDWSFVLPDAARAGLSAIIYLSAALVGWLAAGRFLWLSPDTRSLARLVERARPELREDLLSAVELGQSEPRWDSAQFRARLQENVAGRLRDLHVESLLPRKLIARWLRLAGAVVGISFVLALIPGLRFGELMLRAAAPLANRDRVASTQVRLVAPQDFIAPLGDLVPVVVEVTGTRAGKVVLQTFRAGQGVERMAMNRLATNQFTAGIQMAQQPVQFRIRAGDALTRKFTLTSRARPQVVKFEKTFTYPAYTRLASRKLTEETGDLAALTGTEVALELEVDQPIQQGELQIETADSQATVPLTPAGTNRLSGKITLEAAGTYRVRLVAVETGFENKFSPQYELKPSPDLVPQAELLQPKKDFIAPPDEVVQLQGRAKDDLALANVAQAYRVNNGDWVEIPLAQQPGPETIVARKWDLLPLKLNPGDRLSTKLVATDLKGNKGESAPLQIIISSPGFDSTRLKALDARRAVQDALALLRQAARDLDKAASEATTKLNRGEELPLKQALLNLNAKINEVEELAEKALGHLKAALLLARPGREAADLALTGQVLNQLKHDLLAGGRAELQNVGNEPDEKTARTDLRRATQPLHRASDLAAGLEPIFDDLLAAEHADVLVENLNYLAYEQQRVNGRASAAAEDAQTWTHLARRQSGAAAETRSVEERLQTFIQRLAKPLADRAGKARESLTGSRVALENALAMTSPDKQLASPAAQMQKGIESALAGLLPVERELMLRADKSRLALNKLAGSSFAQLERLRQSVESLDQSARRLEKKQPNPSEPAPAAAQARKTKTLEEQIRHRWLAAAGQFKARAELEELRPEADHFFVADLGNAAEALNALRAAYGAEARAGGALEPLQQLEHAFRALEAGHLFTENTSGLRELAGQERWEAQAAVATTARPKDWQWTTNGWKGVAQELRAAGLETEAAARFQEIAASAPARDVDREMMTRFAQQRVPLPVPEQLEQLLAALGQATPNQTTALAAAREQLAKSTPALSERMKGLARTAGQREQATRETARAAAQDPAAARPETRKLLDAQKDLGNQIDGLREALRRDANVQDLASPEGRARARDNDDAIAMLRDPPAKAEEFLRAAASTKPPATPEPSLNGAAGQQRKTAETLNQLARHFENRETSGEMATRAELRKAEEELGLKSTLDSRYALAEMLAELADKSPEERMAQLQKELQQNEAMQQEMKSIARSALTAAEKSLNRAATDEKNIANDLSTTVAAQQQKSSALAEQAKTIRADARRLAEQDVPAVARQSAEAKIENASALEDARAALEKSAAMTPEEFATNPGELGKEVARLAAPLQEADVNLKAAAQTATKAAKGGSPDAKATQTQTAKTAGQAARLARQAKELANALEAMTGADAKKLNQSAAQQSTVEETVKAAATDLERAGKLEETLGGPQAETLQTLGEETKSVAEQMLPPARAALAKGKNPAAAQAPVQTAQQAIEEQVAKLQAALGEGAAAANPDQAGSTPQAPPNEMTGTEAKSMARALAQMKAGQAQQAAAQAAAMLRQAEQQAMAAARANQPADGTGADALTQARSDFSGRLPELQRLANGEWGRLRALVADDVLEGRQESVAAEYRNMVETYFRVLAEKARGNAP